MAFNPFAVFRRNQKTLFAILTVFIMVMFTLSFGQGDFFQWLPSLLGRNQAGGTEVATIDGAKITDEQLSQLNLRRGLASDFMRGASEEVRFKIEKYFDETLGSVTNPMRREMFASLKRIREMNPPYVSDPQQQFYARRFPHLQLDFMLQAMSQLERSISFLINDAQSEAVDKDLANSFLKLMSLDAQYYRSGPTGYFGHKVDSDDSLRGAFDFEILLKKADKLGIRYSEDDAKQMFAAEFFNQVDGQSLANMEKRIFGNRTSYSRDTIFKALADEFRVRTATSVVMGRNNSEQVFPTPWEMYKYYQGQCNGGTYSIIPVDTDNYLSRVGGEPSQAEFRSLFEKYKRIESDPSRENLGLREPRKLTVGWLEVKGDEPFYKKLGADALAASEAHARAFVAALAPLPGGAFGLIAAPAPLLLSDLSLTESYRALKQTHNLNIDYEWFPSFFGDGLKDAGALETSVLKPLPMALAAAMAGGSLATGAGLLPVPIAFWEQARMDDRAARARALAPLFAVPGPGGTLVLGSPLATWAHLPLPLPLAIVRTDLIEKEKERVRRKVATADLVNFQAEMKKLGEKPDKKEAQEFLAKFLQERGLKSGATRDFRDQFTIGKDDALKPLLERAARGRTMFDAMMLMGGVFFYEIDPFTRRQTPAASLYAPEQFPGGGSGVTLYENESAYLAWRTAELPAESPKDLEKSRPQVLTLWRRIEARKLAEAAANDLANEIRAQADANPETKKEDFATTPAVEAIVQRVYEKYVKNQPTLEQQVAVKKLFQIEDVSPITMPQGHAFQLNPQPQAFQLRPREELPYPTQKMQRELLENKDGKPATTLVLHDESKDHFYVAVLKHRQNRRDIEFYDTVYKGNTELSNAVQGGFHQKERSDEYRSALALLKSEFKVEIKSDKLK